MKTIQDQRLKEITELVEKYGFEYILGDLIKIADQRLKDYSEHYGGIVNTWCRYYETASAKLREIKY